MKYNNICTGIFKERPNRFIAMVEIDGTVEVCHVKNTGRCRELLLPGATVYLEKSGNPSRKTAYDLVSVEKDGVCINMDSAAPNKAAYEWLKEQGWDYIKPECRYGDSRLDFYMESRDGLRRAYMEVKGVTLAVDGVALFPDAPTERGVKHIQELIRAKEQGYESYLLFVIQMKGICHFEPNVATHPAFAEALNRAAASGVQVLAYDCKIWPDSIQMDQPVAIRL